MVKFSDRESRMVVCQRLGGGGNGELMFNGDSVSAEEVEKVLEMVGGNGFTSVNVFKTAEH